MTVGAVGQLWRFPVKSMLGEQVDTVDVTAAGIAGDRAYAILDPATGKVASAKHPRLWPQLLSCRARFVAPPTPGTTPPPARIELGDGTAIRTDAPDAEAVLSAYFGREVRLITAAPQRFVIDEYHPEKSYMNPDGAPDFVVVQPVGASAFEPLGLPGAVPAGALFDLFPISVLTTASLRHLGGLAPDVEWDVRRFRMNVIIETGEAWPAEQAWVGDRLSIGAAVRLDLALPTPRCVMTTLAVEELPRDNRVLKSLGEHNRVDLFGSKFPCLGVYAVPSTPGTIRVGDPVELSAQSPA